MIPAGDAEALVVRRVLPVPRERVFAAWLDPALMARWMCPGDTRSATVELDPRVGGAFRIVMHHGRGDADHRGDRKSTRLNSSHSQISYAVFCLKKKNKEHHGRSGQLPTIYEQTSNTGAPVMYYRRHRRGLHPCPAAPRLRSSSSRAAPCLGHVP